MTFVFIHRFGRSCIAAASFLALTAGLVQASAQTPATTGAQLAVKPRVLLGIDVLERDGFTILRGKRVGLITNPTGLTSDLRSTVDVLHTAPDVQLVALYGPEHGVRGSAAAGDKIDDARDPHTGLPEFSLYGKTRKATPEMLRDVDVLVYDVQDIGSRSYTFISTLALTMEAAAENGKAFVVLDRPNPITGVRVEGRVLDPAFRSFVGQLEVPYVHGMTVGELARMINDEGWLGNMGAASAGAASADADSWPKTSGSAARLRCELTVVPMEGWRREMMWSDTGLIWTPTSPHIPRAESSLFYAATGICGELGSLSIGVGYPLPFELCGAPGIDARRLASELNGRGLRGVFFRPSFFTPFYGAHEKKTCGGIQIVFTDPAQAAASEIQFHLLDAVHRLYPEMELMTPKRLAMFDKVCGGDGMRKRIEQGESIEAVLAHWREGVEAFRERRAKYLLY